MDKGKPVVVVVDDQPVILHSVVAELRTRYNVRPFTSGQTALEYLGKFPADLVIMDYEMPGMSGGEALDLIRADSKTADVPIIILSGTEGSCVESEVLAKGASAYIQKLTMSQTLAARVRSLLEAAGHTCE